MKLMTVMATRNIAKPGIPTPTKIIPITPIPPDLLIFKPLFKEKGGNGERRLALSKAG
jgi:hypothetical protein